MKIAIAFQTNTAEASISQKTANCTFEALQILEIPSFKVPFDGNFIKTIFHEQPTAVFNAMHGKYGEDGYLPTILNALQIPYTHSGVFASQIGMNKLLTDTFAQKCNIPTIPTHTILKNEIQNFTATEKCVIKPVSGGSSVATFVLEKGCMLEKPQLLELENYNESNLFLVQKFVKGREICVGILQNKAIGTVEIHPAEEFFTYNAKYNSTETKYTSPAQLSAEISEKMHKIAENLHNAIGASCISRVDFLLTEDEIFLLEINTHPGLIKTSLLPRIAQSQGISYIDLIKILTKHTILEEIDN